MRVSRRNFMILSASTAAAGCAGGPNAANVSPAAEVDAGPVDGYARDGVYDQHRKQGFFVIRRGSQLVALSSSCTHRRCLLRAEPDSSFACKCHGSTFDPSGHVTQGPATRDLPTLPTRVDADGRLWITVSNGL